MTDRFDQAVFELEMFHYRRMFIHIFAYEGFVGRDDMFEIMTSVIKAQTEEARYEVFKRIHWMTKLIAPEIIRLYYLDEYVKLCRMYPDITYELHPWDDPTNSWGAKFKEYAKVLDECRIHNE